MAIDSVIIGHMETQEATRTGNRELREFWQRTASSVTAGVILYWLAVIFGVLRGPEGSNVITWVGGVIVAVSFVLMLGVIVVVDGPRKHHARDGERAEMVVGRLGVASLGGRDRGLGSGACRRPPARAGRLMAAAP